MAVVDMFLKLDGVDGESQDKDHKNEIDIQGFKLSSKSPRDASTGQATGKVRFTNLTIRSNIEKGTAKLFDKLTKNEKISSAVLVCRKAGKEQFTYFKITLTDCFLARVEVGAGGGDGSSLIPPCEFDIEFGKIEIESKEQVSTGPTSGPVKSIYDLRSNA
jgi:type VI secretion system secreted protein Hcp